MLRSDAQRNLDRLLGAAGECFAEQGLHVSVDEIARRAGVGHGTVFRRFPTKQALLAAVLSQELDAMLVHVRAALAEDDPGAGFERFFRAAAEAYARNRALLEGVDRCRELPQHAPLQEAAETLVRRAQKAGALRRDLTRAEIFELVPAASRFPDVILDGLRPPAG
ncbi:MAG TPA: helix-turn-helix domain-containing protein [Solirubrobacterales bacterium]|nr:helix-turn-helix domain-containing protein [Solirubrobacterales bacterium]